jgi:DNA-directed RNA polymerase specialized sigma24 family protein
MLCLPAAKGVLQPISVTVQASTPRSGKHILLCMNTLSPEKRARILMALIEGNSIASTCRMTGAAKMTILSLIREVGESCLRFHDSTSPPSAYGR